jgi:hypothetical protein
VTLLVVLEVAYLPGVVGVTANRVPVHRRALRVVGPCTRCAECGGRDQRRETDHPTDHRPNHGPGRSRTAADSWQTRAVPGRARNGQLTPRG